MAGLLRRFEEVDKVATACFTVVYGDSGTELGSCGVSLMIAEKEMDTIMT